MQHVNVVFCSTPVDLYLYTKKVKSARVMQGEAFDSAPSMPEVLDVRRHDGES